MSLYFKVFKEEKAACRESTLAYMVSFLINCGHWSIRVSVCALTGTLVQFRVNACGWMCDSSKFCLRCGQHNKECV